MDAFIKAIDYYLPEKILTNDELASRFPEWPAEKIFDKTGILQRHISAPDESASDMAVKAAEKLFSRGNINRDDVDFILFCTQSPDYALPSSACIIQNRLGLSTSTGALDFDLGCSGWVYGLALAKGLIFSGAAKNILLLTGETYTKYIAPDDKGNMSIFSDGASASLICSGDGVRQETRNAGAKIGAFSFGTDGRGANDLIVSKNLRDGESGNLFMNGGNIFAFTLRVVPALVREVLEKNNAVPDLYVMHQANKFMLESLRNKMRLPSEKFFIDMRRGNTVSSTIPIALKDLCDDGKISRGSCVLVAGFGVGLSWCAGVLFF